MSVKRIRSSCNMQRTRLKILSDLHLEAPAAYDIFDISSDNAPYLALLGDIGHVNDPRLRDFLSQQLLKFSIVFFVFGNHEPYHCDWLSTLSVMEDFRHENIASRKKDANVGEFILLNRTRYDLSSDLTILGCTLFSQVIPEQHEYVNFGLNDFYHISNWTVEKHCEAHRRDVDWLNDQTSAILRDEPHRQVVILTHYSPTIDPRSIDPSRSTSNITSGFSSDLRNHACWTNPSVVLWAFGHTHFNCDFTASGKRVYTNQRGYYFSQAAGFDERRVLDLGKSIEDAR